MCGIAGIFNFDRNTHIDMEMLTRMGVSLAHRGPDDEGIFVDSEEPIGFAHRRLSIIDLGGGRQPMSNEQEDVWIVFNGEIYNFPELKTQLCSLGHIFRTKSDTEVIIHGYEQWGLDCLSHLNGMFALAIWDSGKKRLMLARDHAGIKPLYYILNKETLLFGSEIRALLATGKIKPSVDIIGMDLFLRYQYTPSPHTIFEGVKKLAAGSRLVVENGQATVERWWNFCPQPLDPSPSDKKAKEEVLCLYEGAVKRHLLSDVPIGLLLSGGLDSTLLLALMNRLGNDWPTFTVGYGSSFEDDELRDAAVTAERFGTHHAQVEIDRNRFEEALPKIIGILEEPIASPSVVPMYYLCQRARQDVRTVLMGQGPDELFCGYKRHLGVKYGSYWRGVPGPLRKILTSCLGAIPRNEMIKRGLFSLAIEERIERYEQVFSMLPSSLIDGLFHSDILPNDTQQRVLSVWREAEPFIRQTDELGGFSFMEMRYFLPDELLMYGDKISMAHGLEVRVPYLDQSIVKYVLCLPSDYKLHLFTRKWLHRRICKDFLRKHFIGKKKRNFAGGIVDRWFRDTMSGLFTDVFNDDNSQIFQYLEPLKVRKLVKHHLSGRSDYHKLLYSLVVLEEWLRKYIYV
jgi:asparagine synthase (glutamine-hydrolysing)